MLPVELTLKHLTLFTYYIAFYNPFTLLTYLIKWVLMISLLPCNESYRSFRLTQISSLRAELPHFTPAEVLASGFQQCCAPAAIPAQANLSSCKKIWVLRDDEADEAHKKVLHLIISKTGLIKGIHLHFTKLPTVSISAANPGAVWAFPGERI